MKALIFEAPGKTSLVDKAAPRLDRATDAIIKVSKTTICGTDLHILKGDVPSCQPGRTLGHEGVGVVEEVGLAVTQFKKGDHVLISCISSCGKCEYCRRGMYSHCTTGGWILGNTIDGTQAEYVRIPHADTSLYHIPGDADEDALVMLSDILPTGFECGVLNGKIQPGCTVAIVGAGPIGLAALLTAKFYSPARIFMIDLDEHRLQVASTFGATDVVDAGEADVIARILKATGGKGVDTAIEAVGIPATFELCEEIIAPGGTIANIGVHGVKADLHLETLWSKNISITTRLVDTITTPMLLRTVQTGQLDAGKLITHRFKLDEIQKAYETFRQAAATQALKVIIDMSGSPNPKSGEDKTGEPRRDGAIELVTHTGLTLSVRPVRSDDEPLLAEMFRHLTPQDMRFRFLGGMREVSHERLVAMTEVDHRRTENYLAFLDNGKTLVASTMLACDDTGRQAEVAIAVHAEYKHQGVAWELLRYAAQEAKRKGVVVLQSIESREHHDAVRLEREQGFAAKPYPDDATLVLIEKRLD